MTKEEVYEALRVRIVTNSVHPGQILNEKDLMASFGIGRSPLREMLFRLQEEGLLKPLPRLGYMVTTLNISEIRELVELRRELEGFAGQLAAERIAPEQVQRLRELVRRAETENGDARPVTSISGYFDTQFHNLLYDATGNRKLFKILQDLHIVMLRIWFHVGFQAIGFAHQAENIRQVIDALDAGDPGLARAAMESHVDIYAARIRDKLI